MTGNKKGQRLLIVSNRLPLRLTRERSGTWRLDRGSGGLVTALAPVLRNRGGVWIGWPGIPQEKAAPNLGELLDRAGRDLGYRIAPVGLSRREQRLFYEGFSNEVIWPLFHEFPTLANFDPTYWQAYQQVNHKYAEAIAAESQPDYFVWVHDYQLMLVAQELRALGVNSYVAFFLHIPFPPLDVFLKIPWRLEILKALLRFDLLGVQTARDRRNLLDCFRALMPDVKWHGRGRVVVGQVNDRFVRIGDFPISIDYRSFVRRAGSKEVLAVKDGIRKTLADCKILLGVDRLDYTKGIPHRLQAFREALREYPDLVGKTTLIQVVVPSRTGVAQYRRLRAEIERLVGAINGEFTKPGWVPIHYIFRSLAPDELLGYYRAADVALITPLKDGMNLIAKEYCVTNVDNDGVLILSEFAGAASQLQNGAILVNPFHVQQVASAIHQACTMPITERKRRMKKLRQSIRKQDIFWWVDSFLRSAIAKDLSEFPQLDEYMPLSTPPETVLSGTETYSASPRPTNS